MYTLINSNFISKQSIFSKVQTYQLCISTWLYPTLRYLNSQYCPLIYCLLQSFHFWWMIPPYTILSCLKAYGFNPLFFLTIIYWIDLFSFFIVNGQVQAIIISCLDYWNSLIGELPIATLLPVNPYQITYKIIEMWSFENADVIILFTGIKMFSHRN